MVLWLWYGVKYRTSMHKMLIFFIIYLNETHSIGINSLLLLSRWFFFFFLFLERHLIDGGGTK